MTSKSIQRNIKIGIVISYAILAIGILSHLFYTPFLLNYIGDRQYGLFSFVISITSWFNIVTYALNDSFVKISSDYEKKNGNNKTTNTIYLKLLIILSVLVCCVAATIFVCMKTGIIPLNNYSSLEKNIIFIIFIISSSTIAASTIMTFFRLFVEYNEKFIFARSISLGQSLTVMALSIISILLGANVVVIAAIQCFGGLMTLIIYSLYSRFKLKISFARTTLKQEKPLVKTIVTFSSFLLLSTIVGEVNSAADKVLLGFFAMPEYVALYELAFVFPTMFASLSTSINAVFISRLNKLNAAGEKEAVKSLFLRISKLQRSILMLVLGGFLVCGKEFVCLWVGSERISVFYIAITLLLIDSYTFSSYSSFVIERANFKHKIPCILEFCSAFLNILITVILLVVSPKEQAITNCLIGTAIAKILFKWIIIPEYDRKALKLPINRIRFEYLRQLIMSIVLVFAINRIIEITINTSSLPILYTFLIKGSSYFVIYVAIILVMEDEYRVSLKSNLKKLFKR